MQKLEVASSNPTIGRKRKAGCGQADGQRNSHTDTANTDGYDPRRSRTLGIGGLTWLA